MFGVVLRELGDAASGFDVRDGALQLDALVAALEKAANPALERRVAELVAEVDRLNRRLSGFVKRPVI